MASFYRATGRKGYVAQVWINGSAIKIYLGRVTKTQARTICRYLDRLKVATETGVTPSNEAKNWAESVSPRIRNRLETVGLVTVTRSKMPRELGPFLDAYIESRTDWKPKTVLKQQNVRRHLCDELGEKTPLVAITEAAAERYARKVRSNHKSSHAGKLISVARQLIDAARKEQILTSNPFDGIDASQPHDKEREAYVTLEQIERVISKTDDYYGAVFAVTRYAGFRCVSEVLALEWSWIDWGESQIAMDSPKTGPRLLPIFAELRPYLERLYDAAPEGSRYVFDRFRGTADKTYRYNAIKAIELAGVKPWPKLWTNLRASARTDLLEKFPEHVVNAWLGHGSKVGRKHYNRVTPEHYSRASGVAVKSEFETESRQD